MARKRTLTKRLMELVSNSETSTNLLKKIENGQPLIQEVVNND